MKLINKFFGKKNNSAQTDSKSVSGKTNEYAFLNDIIVSTWKELDLEKLTPYLSENFSYNSAWISNTINSKEEYLDYLRKKFETIKKNGDRPLVDVVSEGKFLFPCLEQKGIGVKTVVSYVHEDGKIISIFMRPHIELKVVNMEQWNEFAKAYYENLPLSYQTAGQSIQSYISEMGLKYPEFSWIQTNLISPSFQHLCFRYRTNVYSILVAMHGFTSKDGKDIDYVIVSEQDYNNLLRESENNNFIPCIIPIAARPQRPLTVKPYLIHAVTGECICIENQFIQENIPMSDWEINNMGIQTVLRYLKEQNYRITSYCDLVGIEPQIWFENNGKKSYVIVRSIPIGKRKNIFEINGNYMARLTEYDGYFADVLFASSSPILKDEKGDIVPLSKRDGDEDVWMWRGDSFYCTFIGLQDIETAIETNSFIRVCSKDVYDM